MVVNEQTTAVLPARPSAVPAGVAGVQPVALPVARPVGATGPPRLPHGAYPARARTDRLAIGSAVCGIVAVVPVVCQALGLALGVASLIRIHRARRAGNRVGGTGWAITGLVASLLALLSWAAAGVALSMAGQSLSSTAEALRVLGQ